MSENVIAYNHHGKRVYVEESLKGRHREHCLCWDCGKFYPEPDDMDRNCPIAMTLYNLDVLLNITTPVWECASWVPSFQEIKAEDE